MPHKRRFRRLLTTAAGLAVAAAWIQAPAAHAAPGCRVDYTIRSDWGSGFTGNVKITNTGDAVSGWTLAFTFPGNQRITNSWGGAHTQTGAAVSFRNESWNGSLPTNGTVEVGFNANYSGTNGKPTAFTLNGTPCDSGDNLAPTATLTAPAAGAEFTTPGPISVTAAAQDRDGTVTRVDFYANGALIGSDSTAPYGISWSGVAAGEYSLTARATDNRGLVGAASAPVGIKVVADTGPRVVAEPSSLSVPEGGSRTVAVRLSRQPAANVTVTVARTSGDADLAVAAGGTSRTFTPSNWNVAQNVTITAAEDADTAAGRAEFSASATGHTGVVVTAVEEDNDLSEYIQRFVTHYNKIKNPANGYFSSHGIPYHSVETLIVEAPDYGHVTTSEAFSYYLLLEATYGKVTRDWKPFNDAWALMERYIIPTHDDQPTNDSYNPSKPATYAPELDQPSEYPSPLDFGVQPGQDPLAGELKSAYGTSDIYGMHWLLDVDNRYGYGKCGDGRTSPSYINTFQRGPQESVWETVPQPSCETFTHGGINGFLDLFIKDSSYAKQWRFTNAPDADARAVQAAYWALTWAKEQNQESAISASVSKAAKMGDYLRYSMFDKYFKKIGNCVGASACPPGTGKESAHYLLSWYYAWGGALAGSGGGWAWRIGMGASHQGYQNPMAAYALSTVDSLRPKSASGAQDWNKSLQRQLEFLQWLQSPQGGIAGGATNSWAGRYATPPAGSPTFYGMYYDWQPVWNDPPSNNWFGFQAWGMERVAQYYGVTGDAKAKALLDKWTRWVRQNVTVSGADFQIPADLKWTGKPDTWNPASPGSNAGLSVEVVTRNQDVGIAGSTAKALMYYAARSGDVASRDLAKALLDAVWQHQDAKGVATPEVRADYKRFTEKWNATTQQGLYVPPGWTGRMANGDVIDSNSTFLSIRSWYTSDPDYPKVDAFLKGTAPAPEFTYHRFWAQVDVATALADYGRLFG